jgi:predicted nucleic acid-binding protein
LGRLLRSKQMGLLEAVEPTLSAMMALGFRISGELVDATLDLADAK